MDQAMGDPELYVLLGCRDDHEAAGIEGGYGTRIPGTPDRRDPGDLPPLRSVLRGHVRLWRLDAHQRRRLVLRWGRLHRSDHHNVSISFLGGGRDWGIYLSPREEEGVPIMAEEKRADETLPGGVYVNADGILV